MSLALGGKESKGTWVHNLLKELQNEGVRCNIEETDDGRVVLKKGNIVLEIREEFNLRKIRAMIKLLKAGKTVVNELMIGIDPNLEYCTTAVVGDGVMLDYYNIDCTKIGEAIRDILSYFPHRRVGIGIGSGIRTMESFRVMDPDLFRFLVDEEGTSKDSPYVPLKDRQVRAAYKIALRGKLI